MKLYVRKLRDPLLTMFMVIILAAACPTSALDAAAEPDRPDFPPAIVRCDPSYAENYTNGTVTVDLYLEDTQNTYGIDVQVTFDENIATVVDKNDYAPGTQLLPLYSWFVPGFIITNVACNPRDPSGFGCSTPEDVGTIWYAATQLNPTPPVNGSGPFARVTFQPVTFGTFTMHFFYHKLSNPVGEEVESIAEDCTIRFISPLAVELASFTAQGEATAVVLHWETVSEVDHMGFNVLRADAVDGPWHQVNQALIPAVAPGASAGDAYVWEDRAVEPGSTYYYALEDISLDGTATRHEPIAVTMELPNVVGLRSFTGRAGGNLIPVVVVPLALLLFAMRRMQG